MFAQWIFCFFLFFHSAAYAQKEPPKICVYNSSPKPNIECDTRRQEPGSSIWPPDELNAALPKGVTSDKIQKINITFGEPYGSRQRELLLGFHNLNSLILRAFIGGGEVRLGDALKPLRALEWLSMEGVNFQQSDITQDVKNGLKRLHLYNTRVGDLSNFKDYKRLEEFIVIDSDIDKIPQDAFGESAEDIKSITISRTPLTVIHTNSFTGFHNLTRLVLAENQINNIETKSFDDLKKLRSLDLRNNELKVLTADLFKHTTSLCKLQLEGNPKELKDESFDKAGCDTSGGWTYGVSPTLVSICAAMLMAVYAKLLY